MNEVMLARSLKNCHCDGLDSLVIKDSPQMIRIFLAKSHHVLFQNNICHRTERKLSVALHRHHCDVTLMPLMGNVFNVGFSKNGDAETWPLASFRYKSPITGSQGSFESVDDAYLPMRLRMQKITTPLRLAASTLHTIYVPYGETAAWMVWEGEENPGYSPIVYSNADLTEFNFIGLNEPMMESEIRADLEMLGVRDA